MLALTRAPLLRIGVITTELNEKKCIDYVNRPNGNVQLWGCSGQPNQDWHFLPSGLIQAGKPTGSAGGNALCMQVEADKNVVVAPCDENNPSQVFRVEGVGARHSQAGCLCKHSWSLNDQRFVYPRNCGNPGNLHDFSWCPLEGTGCVGVDGHTAWDRCDPSVAAVTSALYTHEPGTVGVARSESTAVERDETPLDKKRAPCCRQRCRQH